MKEKTAAILQKLLQKTKWGYYPTHCIRLMRPQTKTCYCWPRESQSNIPGVYRYKESFTEQCPAEPVPCQGQGKDSWKTGFLAGPTPPPMGNHARLTSANSHSLSGKWDAAADEERAGTSPKIRGIHRRPTLPGDWTVTLRWRKDRYAPHFYATWSCKHCSKNWKKRGEVGRR